MQDTVITAILDSLEKKDYLTMPMSTLYLFDRPQDYGFAHAEPVRVAMSRNHLRAWKSPYEVDGRPLWCIAATHDIGFERDQRNNGVTHKIDPAIDGEREYVNGTLAGTGLVIERDHVTARRRPQRGQNRHRRQLPLRRPNPRPHPEKFARRREVDDCRRLVKQKTVCYSRLGVLRRMD